MNKLFIFSLMGCLVLLLGLFSGLFLIDVLSLDDKYNEDKPNIYNEEVVYQGAVPQGYNLEHFRKTGETIRGGIN